MSTYWDDLVKQAEGLNLKPAKGKILDHYGLLYEIPRKRYLFLFKEWDYFYRKRITNTLKHPKRGLHD